MSKYSWSQYNKNKLILSKKMLSYNQKHKINFFENGLYNHVRDIFTISLLLAKKKYKKLNILDYGSNIACLSNIHSKIDTKFFNFYIFDPFAEKEFSYSKPFKIKVVKKKLKNKSFDVINFGSCLQYIENLSEVKKSKQSNQVNLSQIVHSFENIKKFFLKEKFKLIFKSRNNDKFIACRNKKTKTFSLNFIFQKI